MIKSDLIVVGAGPGGYELAAEAANRGLYVTIIEKSLLGGTCLNRGCIPTKALLASAAVLRSAREAAAYGIDIDGIKACYSRAADRKDTIVNELREGVKMALSKVTVVGGEARFVAPNVVAVADETYEADRIVVATGSEPAMLPIAGAEFAMTSDQLLGLTELPRKIVIIGGGVIGMEFACILHEFGVEVSVIEYCKEILPPFDRDIAKRLRTALSRRGINIIVGAAAKAITPTSITYEQRGKELTIDTDMTLMAVGRRPVIPAGLADAGVEITPRGIVVDDEMQTNVPGIYAIGDVNGRCMLAHAATAQGKRLLDGDKINLSVIPSAVFTMPECAMVGLTEEQCREKGHEIKVGKSLFRANGKAQAMGETDGMVKMIADVSTGQILGCHIMGPHAADLVQAVADVMTAGVTVDVQARTVHGHPTLGEVVASAAAACL